MFDCQQYKTQRLSVLSVSSAFKKYFLGFRACYCSESIACSFRFEELSIYGIAKKLASSFYRFIHQLWIHRNVG